MARLLALRLKGFKTFARPTELLFEPGIAVIIGPNGSGKSNIADAVLWALGEQSPSNIRGRSMQDVIFSGSDGRKPVAGAEVSLVFDNASGALPLDYGEIEITRWVSRDGGSGYRLNGSNCRLTDIQELIATVGLGREMHSVISQGKVEEFLSSTPQTRRALVEEAAGLGRYKKRRQRAQAKLEKARSNLERVRDIEREVKNALRPLKQQVTAAERFAQATEELAEAQSRLLLHELAEIGVSQAESRGRLDEVLAARREGEAELADVREQRTREEERFTHSLRAREQLASQFHQARAGVERLQSRAESLRQRLARLESEAARAARRRELAEAELATAERRLAECVGLTGGEGRRALLEQATARIAGALAELEPSLRLARAEEDQLKDEVFDLEASRSRLLQEQEFLRRELTERGRRREELELQSAEAGERLARLQAEITSLEEVLAQNDKEAGEAAASLEGALSQRDAAVLLAEREREAERELRVRLEEQAARRRVLEGIIQRQEGLPSAARHLRDRFPGALLIAEALRVKPGYEAAVSAALGPLIHAVFLPGARDLGLITEAEGPLEVIWPAPGPENSTLDSPPSATKSEDQACSLWDVVSGPPEMLASLRRLVPESLLVVSEAGRADGDAPGPRVTLDGLLLNGSWHASRRRDAGAEALLGARSELESISAEQDRLEERLSVSRENAQAAERGRQEALRLVSAREAAQRELLKAGAALQDELQLFRRRLEEAREEEQSGSLRMEEDRLLGERLAAQADELEGRQRLAASELEERRLQLRAVREQVEDLKMRASILEQKKSQAAILTVRLRERLRLQEEEEQRARQRRGEAARAAGTARVREKVLLELLPKVRDLAQVAGELAGIMGTRVSSLEGRVEESRRAGDLFAQVVKELGQREADLQQRLSAWGESLVEVQVALAHLEDRAEERERDLAELRRRHLSPRRVGPEDVRGWERDALVAAVGSLERRRERIGPVNPLAEQEYREASERAEFLAEQREDLEHSLRELERVVSDLDEHIETTFAEVFAATRDHFKEMVGVLFPGGKGLLKLVEPETVEEGGEPGDAEPAEEDVAGLGRTLPGIVLEIKPPKKAPRSMSLLSGGEKALAAIAFLFALFLARPCPFYILDEVEAALDDVNIGRFLSLVSRYQNEAQFIIITHQRRTMEIADRLYGVAMDTDGTSRVLSRRLEKNWESGQPG